MYNPDKTVNSPVKSRPVKTYRQVVWTKEQIASMVDHCDANGRPSIGTLIILCYHFCQRAGDMRELKWSSIGKDRIVRFNPRKTNSTMEVPLTKGLRDRLKLHKHTNPDDVIVRCETTGQPYSNSHLHRVFSKLREASELPNHVWLTDLRRTGITFAAADGCTERELRILGGYKLARAWYHVPPRRCDEVADAMKKRNL
jgi:integrase